MPRGEQGLLGILLTREFGNSDWRLEGVCRLKIELNISTIVHEQLGRSLDVLVRCIDLLKGG